MKKKGLIIGAVILALVVVLAGACIGSYNGLVKMNEGVATAQSNIQTQLQRRADLIPNLVNTVKGYAAHEEEVYTAIADARAAVAGASTVDEMSEANSALDSAISRLLMIVENYPDLKANQNFINLQDELAGTENRITQARKDYNDAAKDYNTKIKTFPTSVIAGIFNFDAADYFEASAEAGTVPNVDFN